MKKKHTLCIYIIGISILISCNGQNKDKVTLKDTVVKEIPLAKAPRYKGELGYSYKFKNDLQKELNLNSIETGFDSIYIRVWYGGSKTDTMKLFEFWNTQREWFAKRTLFLDPNIKNVIKMEKQAGFNDIQPDSFRIESVLLLKSSEWNDFTKSIFNLGITKLPDDSSIPNYSPDTDGDRYIFEVATKSKYRLFGYSDPVSFKDKFWQADSVAKIVSLINNIYR